MKIEIINKTWIDYIQITLTPERLTLKGDVSENKDSIEHIKNILKSVVVEASYRGIFNRFDNSVILYNNSRTKSISIVL